jgi:hypothetical protein
MKKILILFASILLLTGCMRIDKTNLDDLVSGILESKINIYNHTNSGFKYYLPSSLSITKHDEYNEILKDNNYEYYLYVDLVSYYNKSITSYSEDSSAYYSKLITKDNKSGIINVVSNNDGYLVTVTYNYATIQVVAEEKDINKVVSNALIVASTIDYYDDIIKRLLEEDELSSTEETVNIFDNREDTITESDEDISTEDAYDVYDTDVIN